jgi:hypothetical protein
MQRIALALAGALIALTFATPSHATLNACSAAKKKCVAKKAAALLKCHTKNEKPPAGLTPVNFALCLQKAKDKFDGGLNPAKGCFAKLEAKFPPGPGGCLTINDTAALEAKVDAFVDDVVCELDAGSGTCPVPTPTPTPPPNPTPTSTPAGCSANGQLCAFGSQCCSLSCMANVCQAPSCLDMIKNGTETGIDCGGGTCPACGTGQGCNVTSDCVSGVCMGGTCHAPTCTDLVKNGNETDVDCGGGTCPACPSGKSCSVGTDCMSNICSGNVCN